MFPAPAGDGYAKLSLSQNNLDNIKSSVMQDRACASRVTFAFAARLAHAHANGLGYHQIIDEIDYLEGLRGSLGTKREAPFEGPILGPFWHKHFSTPRHFFKNIGIHWALDKEGNSGLDKLLRRILRQSSERWVNQLCHQIVLGGYTRRARQHRLTGDWIVFAKHDGQNYYLDLATHSEAKDEARLLNKIRLGSQAEFPFLFA